MKQTKHTPEVQVFLDRLAEIIPVGPVPFSELKHPDCPYDAGSIPCLNALSRLCKHCDWWDSYNDR
jgi:hypothetical protein